MAPESLYHVTRPEATYATSGQTYICVALIPIFFDQDIEIECLEVELDRSQL